MLIDVFRQDPFTAIALTQAVERVPFVPTGIGELDLFEDKPIYTQIVMIEERNGILELLPTTPRGGPLTERKTEKRTAIALMTPRLAHGDTLLASEIDSIRAFGSETEMEVAQTEIARRLSGPTGLMTNMELTYENHRLGAIQGILLDADGSTLYNYYTQFGIQPAPVIQFNLTAPNPVDGALRTICNQTVRSMSRSGQGAVTSQTEFHALCGDQFWDALVNHPDVTKTYYNYIQAETLRRGTAFFQRFPFGDIYWSNYRGTDDLTTIAIPSNACRIFPKNAKGVFQVAWSPAETFDFVNTLGRKQYVIPIMDRDRNAFWRMELYSYPLYYCTRPEMLRSGVM